MKKKWVILGVATTFLWLFSACSSVPESASETSSSEMLESKKLTAEDVEMIKLDDELSTVYETLGKPLKKWDNDFVYDQIDTLIVRNENLAFLLEGTAEAQKSTDLAENGRDAKDIENLFMLQYTFLFEDKKNTLLVWIDPTTDKVVLHDTRTFINKDGERETEASSEAEEKDSSEKTSESSTSSIGARSNPTPFNSVLKLSGTFTDPDADDSFSAAVHVTVVSTIRGEAAWEQIVAENRYNDPAPEGKEYIINRVKIELKNATSEDMKTSFSSYDFDYISGNGASYQRKSVVLADEFSASLYNNGIAEGNICGLIDKGDSPLLRMMDKFFFQIV